MEPHTLVGICLINQNLPFNLNLLPSCIRNYGFNSYFSARQACFIDSWADVLNVMTNCLSKTSQYQMRLHVVCKLWVVMRIKPQVLGVVRGYHSLNPIKSLRTQTMHCGVTFTIYSACNQIKIRSQLRECNVVFIDFQILY